MFPFPFMSARDGLKRGSCERKFHPATRFGIQYRGPEVSHVMGTVQTVVNCNPTEDIVLGFSCSATPPLWGSCAQEFSIEDLSLRWIRVSGRGPCCEMERPALLTGRPGITWTIGRRNRGIQDCSALRLDEVSCTPAVYVQ